MLPPGTTHVQYMYTPFSWIIGLQLCGIETNWIPCNQHVYIVQVPSGNSTCRHIEKHLVIVEIFGNSTCRHVGKHLVKVETSGKSTCRHGEKHMVIVETSGNRKNIW